MNNFPLVSLITPTYNREAYLEETIQSVLSQDYPNIEYIVLDDGSTDNTQDVLKKYDGRIIAETHANMGETRTVNRGLELATGELICVVNSDDPILPGAIRAGVENLLKHPDALAAYADWMYIDQHSRKIEEIIVPEYDYVHMIRRHHCFVQSAVVARKSALDRVGGRDEQFKYVGDFDLWMRMGLYGPFVRTPGVYGTFRVHPDSTSIKLKKFMALEDIRLIKKYYSLPALPPEILAVQREAFSRAYHHAAQNCEPDHWLAWKYYLLSFWYYPPTFTDKMVLRRLADIYIVPSWINKAYQASKRIVKRLFHKTV